MKTLYKASAVCLFALTLSSCGGGNNGNNQSQSTGTVFTPKERTSSLNDEDRQAAIATKKASLSVDMATALNSHGVKLSVLPPMPHGEDITEAIAERIAVKMLQITTANGVGGLGNVPSFALTASVDQTGRATSGSTSQKMIVKYEVTYQVINVASGDVYSTSTQEIMGVGNTFEEANRNSVDEIKNTPAMQQMLQTGCERIVSWYNANVQTLKNQVEDAKSKKDFALALALVEAVPQQATEAFEYATKVQPELLIFLQKKHAADELAAMHTAIANAGSEYSAEVVAHMQMIPTDSPEYGKAQKLLSAYVKRIAAKEAYAQQLAETEAKHAQKKELAQIEADKIKAKYEAESSATAIELATRKRITDESKGFWARIGTQIIDAIDK